MKIKDRLIQIFEIRYKVTSSHHNYDPDEQLRERRMLIFRTSFLMVACYLAISGLYKVSGVTDSKELYLIAASFWLLPVISVLTRNRGLIRFVFWMAILAGVILPAVNILLYAWTFEILSLLVLAIGVHFRSVFVNPEIIEL